MSIERVRFIPSTAANSPADQVITKSRASEPPAEPQHPPEQEPKSPASSPVAQEVPQYRVSLQVDQNKQVYYQVVDERTGDVIRQVPPEEILRIARNITEFLKTQQSMQKSPDTYSK